MVFSNVLLVFLISLQFGMYGLMVDNGLKAFTGHMQVQAPGFLEDEKMRLTLPAITELARQLRVELASERVAARAQAFVLASSEDRSYGIAVLGVEADFEPIVSSIPGLVSEGRYLAAQDTDAIVIGALLARNLRVTTGDELTLLGSGLDGSFAAAVVRVVGIFDTGIAEVDAASHNSIFRFSRRCFSCAAPGTVSSSTRPSSTRPRLSRSAWLRCWQIAATRWC